MASAALTTSRVSAPLPVMLIRARRMEGKPSVDDSGLTTRRHDGSRSRLPGAAISTRSGAPIGDRDRISPKTVACTVAGMPSDRLVTSRAIRVRLVFIFRVAGGCVRSCWRFYQTIVRHSSGDACSGGIIRDFGAHLSC
ncbi:hypothetical protein SDC9_170079 [bioreactor metagenome]|uniref:Uncharacterized protein n=1 Tax=bioreactor metagenome TaxID=1076179 RepID=A0A645G9B0_9ZZZZ